jgi:hypothetical protein
VASGDRHPLLAPGQGLGRFDQAGLLPEEEHVLQGTRSRAPRAGGRKA